MGASDDEPEEANDPEWVKREFAPRFRRQLLLVAAAPAAFLLLGRIAPARPPFEPWMTPWVVPIAIAIGGFSLWNWRCPACRRYLRWQLLAKDCYECGVRLRD